MTSLSRKAVGLAALTAILGATALGVTAAPALAAYPSAPVSPTFAPDPNSSNGSVTFYDAAGKVVTGGTNLSHLFDYARASSNGRSGATRATAYFAFPDHTQADTQTWNSQQVTASTLYPNNTYPGPLATATQPVAKAVAADADLAGLLLTSTEDTTAGYAGYLQIRVYDSGPTAPIQSTPWWSTVIAYDKTAGTWKQVFPSVPTTAVSTIAATPATPAASGTTSVALSATLSASDSTHPTGSVELFNGATDLGPATFNAATGAISKTATVVDNGNYNFTFAYSPDVAYGSSVSPALAYTVNGPSQATTTVVTGPTTAVYGTASTFHADVKKTVGGTAVPASAGAVQFKVDGVNSGSPVALTATGADYSYNPPQPVAPATTVSQTITAVFVSASVAAYGSSADATGVVVLTTTPANAPDPQTFVASVPQGSLVISTPYTPANPFNLGTMQLNAIGTQLSASAPFGDPAAPAATDPGAGSAATVSRSNGVTITDTRATSTGWSAYAQTTDFTNPSLNTPIDGNLLSFTGVTPKYLTGNNLQAGNVLTNDITAFKSVKKSFATTGKGPGTVNITGVMTLLAPTSTKAGLYTATVTFTIV